MTTNNHSMTTNNHQVEDFAWATTNLTSLPKAFTVCASIWPSGVRYTKSLLIWYFIDANTFQNTLINIFKNVFNDIDIDSLKKCQYINYPYIEHPLYGLTLFPPLPPYFLWSSDPLPFLLLSVNWHNWVNPLNKDKIFDIHIDIDSFKKCWYIDCQYILPIYRTPSIWPHPMTTIVSMFSLVFGSTTISLTLSPPLHRLLMYNHNCLYLYILNFDWPSLSIFDPQSPPLTNTKCSFETNTKQSEQEIFFM